MRARWIVTLALLLAALLVAGCAPKGTFSVKPGEDDATAIQAVVDEALAFGPGAVVQLAKGDYMLSGPLSALNFCGTIRGQGSDATVLRVPSDSPLALWTDPEGDPWGVVFGLLYDNSEPCQVRFEGLTVDVAGQSAVRQDASGAKTGALDVFYLRGLGEPRPVSVAWRDVVVRGAVSEDFVGSSHNVQAAVRMAGLNGTQSFSASTIEVVDLGFVLDKTNSGGLTLGGDSEDDLATLSDMSSGVRIADGVHGMRLEVSHVRASAISAVVLNLWNLNGCHVHVSDLVTEDASVLDLQACTLYLGGQLGPTCASEPNEIVVENSQVGLADSEQARTAFNIMDNEKTRVSLLSNEIRNTGHIGVAPVEANGTQGMTIQGNRFVGSGPAAVYVSMATSGGTESGMRIVDNDFSQWTTDGGTYEPDWHGYAAVALGARTSGVTVSGCGDPKVVVYDETDRINTPEYDGKNIIEGLSTAQSGG